MSIVILILKIIGILLLAILGLVLLAVVCLLFVPVRYRIWGKAGGKIDVHARASWLLHILRFQADYDGKKLKSRLLVFGVSLRGKKGKAGKADPGKKEKKVKVGNPEDDKITEISERAEESRERAEKSRKNAEKSRERAEESKESSAGSKESAEESKESSAESRERTEGSQTTGLSVKKEEASPGGKEAKNRLTRIRSFFQKIRELPGLIRSKWEIIKETVKGWKKTPERIWKEMKDEQNREALKLVWRELKVVLKRIAPRKIQIDASFALGDPANTGQALGAISVLPFVYRYQIHLYPDFEAERTYFEGTFDIRGKIYGIHVLILLLHLLLDKNIRGLIERYHS